MREFLAKAAVWPGRIVRNTSVATRLSLVVVLVALISLAITSFVGLQQGGQLADGILRVRTESLGETRADEVERYVASLERAVIGKAISPSTAQAISDFADAYAELDSQEPSGDDQDALETYYVDIVAPTLSAVRDRPVSAVSLLPRGPAAVQLQANYVVPSDGGGGLLTDAGDGSRWSELHSSLHQPFDEFAIQNGLDDFYLIEPIRNTIVYSTAKDVSFATSLLTGPQSGSSLAVLIQSFSDEPEPGVAVVRDFASYVAAGDEPSLFVATPVFADGSLAGFVALRIGPDKISSITTNDSSWRSQGETGETYVVAGDGLMRSDARGFIEDRESYLSDVIATGAATETEARSMEAFGTTVLFQHIDDDDVDAALDDGPRVVETSNYLEIDVLQARRSLDIEGLEWAMITEVAMEELNEPIVDFGRNLLIAIGLFLVTITFLAVRWSDRLLQPLRIVSTNLRAVRAGRAIDQGASVDLIPEDTTSEFVELARDIDTMLETLAARNEDAAARADEHGTLLRRILPPQAAQRAEAGERNVVDQVDQASIAVVVISGLGELMRAGSADEARFLLDQFVEEADALAKQRGLERIRLTGDAYFAACGTVRPHIDHAARAVSFALDVRDLVQDLGDDDQLISMVAGIDSGPVTIGLTGGAGLVYDSWGSTVQRAAALARQGGLNEVRVSATTRAQLPSTFLAEEHSGAIDEDGTATVTGRANHGVPSQ